MGRPRPDAEQGINFVSLPLYIIRNMMWAQSNKVIFHVAWLSALLLPGSLLAVEKASVPPHAAQSFAGCERHFPTNQPLALTRVDPAWRPYALCAGSFAVMYSGLTKTPMVVVERMTATSLIGARTQQRTNDFLADQCIPARDRAELSDYQRSGYARGHMGAAANMPDRAAMSESFLLTNIVPQDFQHNAQVWAKVESATRRYVQRAKGDVFVFTGPLFLGQVRTIGRGGVWVPSHIFKLVYDASSGRSWAFFHMNSADQRMEAPIPYEEFLARTGWDLLASPHRGVSL
jgi:endonuclease G